MVRLPQSLSKGINIITLGKNTEEIEKIEFRSEIDDDFARLNIYTAKDIQHAVHLAREKEAHLAVFEDGVEDRDYVYIQLELQNACSKIQVIPIVNQLNLSQISESQKAGNLYQLCEDNILYNYDSFKQYIQRFIRDRSQMELSDEKSFQDFRTISNTIQVSSKLEIDKVLSRQILGRSLGFFDFNFEENKNIALAEMIYSPDFSMKEYEKILGNKYFEILEILEQTSSWKQNSSPKSSQGFLISFCNYSAFELGGGKSVPELTDKILTRPIFLKHRSIRAFNENNLTQLLSAFTERGVKYGS